MKKEPQLQFGEVRGQYRLSQDEEKAFAKKGEEWVKQELTQCLSELESMTVIQALTIWTTKNRFRFNSLIWVYMQLASKRVIKNVEILMTFVGIKSINQLAEKSGMNASFAGRLLAMTCSGGWNHDNLFRLSTALNVNPKAILFTDLEKTIQEQIDVFGKEKKVG